MAHHLWSKALLATVLTFSLTALPAGAATCSGSGCTGQSPISTGCAEDAVWITAAPMLVSGSAVAYVHLMWSPTCETVWSRLSTYSAQSGHAHQAWLANGPFSVEGVTTSDAPPAPDATQSSYYDDYTEVIDPVSLTIHLESTMRHRDNSLIRNGVKACGRIYGVVASTCTTQLDPHNF